MSGVRVRFAPSPTGELHVGGLRTALFNWLYARHHGGTFVLRIEDTDQERYVPEAEGGIVDMLQWAGVVPDEGPLRGGPHGPYRQSERLALYREAAGRLLEAGRAYRCYVTPEELEQMRAEQLARGESPKYDGRHRDLSDAERRRFENEGRRPVIRMRIPDGDEPVVVDDLVRGRVTFSSGQLDDQVLLKSDGYPTYHLSVVVDDHHMGISHVLRAEEWLSSTPKHLYLYDWLGWTPPQHAHLPLLLNPDRSKMSKRAGDTAAEAYRDKGYLPEALVNFLALLGWHPESDQELFSREELIEQFSLERIHKAGAVFDRAKLDWMNQTYIGRLEPGALYEACRPYIERTPHADAPEAVLRGICETVQPRLVTLADIAEQLPLFFRADDAPVSAEVREALAGEAARAVCAAMAEHLRAMEGVDRAGFMQMIKQVQKETGVKGKGLWVPARAAITLEAEGPDLARIVEIFGRDKTLARLERAAQGQP